MKPHGSFWISPLVVAGFLATKPILTAQYAYTTIDPPLVSNTVAYGISGNNIVGSYEDSSGGASGFLYNGSSYTMLNDPSGVNAECLGIDGTNIVGTYVVGNELYGFLYNGNSYTTINDPLANRGTRSSGISGTNIVGYYWAGDYTYHGFIYNGNSYTTLDDPLGVYGTYAFGISGTNIVGYYFDSSHTAHGFIYNGSSFTTLTDPLAGSSPYRGTFAQGVFGDNIVGYYLDSTSTAHGFIYNGRNYTTIDIPLAVSTWVHGISGNSIVGAYLDDRQHGFEATLILNSAPQILTNYPTFGIWTNCFCFYFSGSVNQIVVVEACNDLMTGGWVPMQTNVVGIAPAYFADPLSANVNTRFYRLHVVQ